MFNGKKICVLRRLPRARVLVVVLSVLAISLPAFLLYEKQEVYVVRPRMPDTRSYKHDKVPKPYRRNLQVELRDIPLDATGARGLKTLSRSELRHLPSQELRDDVSRLELRQLTDLYERNDYYDVAEEEERELQNRAEQSVITLSPEINSILDGQNYPLAQRGNTHPNGVLRTKLHPIKSTHDFHEFEDRISRTDPPQTLATVKVEGDYNHFETFNSHISNENARLYPLLWQTLSEDKKDRSIGTCQEIRKVALVKTHKTGSTTIMNIIQRFGYTHKLIIALPKSGNYLGFGTSIQLKNLLPPPRGKTYDMIINHVVYNRAIFSMVLPQRTSVYVTIIREPFSQFVSTIEYLKDSVGYIKKLPRRNPVSAFLDDPIGQESKDYKWSFTNNRMSFDLGLNRTLFHNEAAVETFIGELDKDFKLVMILERVAESLVLLKRYLCWSLKDILYVSRNVNTKKVLHKFTADDRRRYKEWAYADYQLYDFFFKRFLRQVEAEGTQFPDEVHVFKKALSMLNEFCTSRRRSRLITIPETKWNAEFTIRKTDCEYMLMDEIPFLLLTRNDHLKNIRGQGYRDLPKPALIGEFGKPIRRSGHPRIIRRSRIPRTINRRRFRKPH